MTRFTRVFQIALCVVCLAGASCDRDANTPPTVPVEQVDPQVENGPHGNLLADKMHQQFAIYLLDDKPRDLSTEAKAEFAKQTPRPSIIEKVAPDMSLPAVFFDQPDISIYAPPDAESLPYFAVGLNDEQLRKTPAAKRAFVVIAFAEREQATAVHRATLATMHRLCARWGGVLWDEDTREVFSADSWRETRLAWQSGPPDITKHITLHAYRNGPLIRIVTLGMRKFGLPDVVANNVASNNTQSIGSLINLTCQTLVERPVMDTPGRLEVNLDEIQNPSARLLQQSDLLENAERKQTLTLAYIEPEEGDAENRLLEIVFTNAAGDSPQVVQDEVVGTLYGSHDEITYVNPSDEQIEAARTRAVIEVMKLKPSFADGPDLNEQLLVKAPFPTSNGSTEWMWVEVVTWEGSTIAGILANDPFEVPDLKAGATVEVNEKDLFDYIHQRPDGTRVGNETGRLIMKLQGEAQE